MALIAALAFPVMLGFVGLAVEVAGWLLTQRILQGVADAAAFSASLAYTAGNTNGYATEGLAVAAQNGWSGGGNVTVAVNIPPQTGNYSCASAPANCNNYVEANITQTQNTLIAALFGVANISLSGHAVVSLGNANSGNDCVLALNPTKSGAVTLNGTANVNLSCGIAVDSSSASALLMNGNSTLTATSATIVGNKLLNGVNTYSVPDSQTGAQPVPDPYAGTSPPAPANGPHACPAAFTNKTFNGAGGTLSPGTYCGNIVINGSGFTVNVSPGTYILNQGSLIINGSPTITSNGNGVSFVFTSSTGSSIGGLTDSGSPVLNLTAENSGPTSGFVFYQDRRASSAGSDVFNGAANSKLTGALYFPNQSLTYNGTAQQGPGCTQVIAGSITFNGTPSLAVDNCTGVGVTTFGGGAGKLVE